MTAFTIDPRFSSDSGNNYRHMNEAGAVSGSGHTYNFAEGVWHPAKAGRLLTTNGGAFFTRTGSTIQSQLLA